MTVDAYSSVEDDDDAPSAAMIEKQAKDQVGFSDEDEIGEFERSVPETSFEQPSIAPTPKREASPQVKSLALLQIFLMVAKRISCASFTRVWR